MTLETRLKRLEQLIAHPQRQEQRDRETFGVIVVVAEHIGKLTDKDAQQLLTPSSQGRSEPWDDEAKDRARRLVAALLNDQRLPEEDQRFRALWARYAPTIPFPWGQSGEALDAPAA